jgi:hypothetical protein
MVYGLLQLISSGVLLYVRLKSSDLCTMGNSHRRLLPWKESWLHITQSYQSRTNFVVCAAIPVIIVRVERRKKFGKPNEIALHCWLQYMLLDRGNMYKLRKAAVDYSASLFDIISFLLKLTCYEFCISASPAYGCNHRSSWPQRYWKIITLRIGMVLFLLL